MNTKSKIFIVRLIISYFLMISYSAICGTSLEKDKNNEKNICSSKDCETAANAVLQNVDFSVNPCDNFYKYACGNFVKNIDQLNNKIQIDQFTITLDRVINQIKKAIENESEQQTSKTFKLIKSYYQSCINTSEIENRKLKPLKDFIQKLGGWPVLSGDSWKETNFSWEKTDRLLGRKPENIFHLYLMKDVRNSSRNMIYLSPSPNENNEFLQYGFKDNRTLAYFNYMVDIAVILGANRKSAMSELRDVILFENKLANGPFYAENFNSEMFIDRITIQHLQKMHPFVSWHEYINNVTHPYGNFSGNYEIHIDYPVYLQAVKNILANSTKRTVANYMIWRTVSSSIDYLNNAIRSRKQQFSNILNEKNLTESRKEECLKTMIENNDGLLAGISAIYVSKYFSNNTREKVNELVTKIQKHYDNILRQSSWLDEDTKREALKKSEHMKKVIGYPDELVDMKIVDEYYKNLQFNPDNYFENAMKLKEFTYKKSVENFRKSPNETFWLNAGIAAYINVQYNLLYNAMILPASIIQPPFFNENQPNYLNYGALGFLIGHEMTHAFQWGDSQFDEDGSQRTWWSENDQQEYQEKSFCFISQYDNFSAVAADISLGTATIKENIADILGMKITFETYKNSMNLCGNEKQLPKLNHTNDQLFWISAASTLCTARTQQNEKHFIESDDHSLEEFRINGVMMNSVDFAKSFNCKNNTFMNPELKCTLW